MMGPREVAEAASRGGPRGVTSPHLPFIRVSFLRLRAPPVPSPVSWGGLGWGPPDEAIPYGIASAYRHLTQSHEAKVGLFHSPGKIDVCVVANLCLAGDTDCFSYLRAVK
ncbi:hypothetical protein [Laspinema olomoucense]|uniref:hypothetical protein n=1 Tax=Laspinema olomoucense TaxID=3231600 RepID=UPI0021BB845B|nr:hypothetical protein [Laspinema sp. D3c]